jgi:AcrR family transcriptional regulator
VWDPVAERAPGVERLLALCDAWMAYHAADELPGGCFLTAASAEFDGREGPVRDAIRDALARWLAVLAREVRAAVRAGDLAPDTDPERLAYAINALALGANQARQLLGDDDAPERSRRLMHQTVLAHRPRG